MKGREKRGYSEPWEGACLCGVRDAVDAQRKNAGRFLLMKSTASDREWS